MDAARGGRLAEHYRVITYSLCDERSSPFRMRSEALGSRTIVRAGRRRARSGRARAARDRGVSYGGLIAAEFAARHPERVSDLVLASALPTDWTPDARARFICARPGC